jgi:hypothetical protein
MRGKTVGMWEIVAFVLVGCAFGAWENVAVTPGAFSVAKLR